VTGHCDHVAADLLGDGLHEPGLPATGWALAQQGKSPTSRADEDLHLVADGPVKRRASREIKRRLGE
jgi:hypothetical protein